MITTKLVPPRYRRKLVDRQRLIDQLEDASDRSLIFLKAASGFGKTSLLTQWRQVLVAQGCKVGWLNLDDSDNEVSQFLVYVMAALQKAGCDFGQGALAVYHHGEPDSIEAFATALINDLSSLEDEIYLVLEDFHCITNKALHVLIERLLVYTPANFHLVISSRTELPFSLGQLHIHDDVAEIGVIALRFTHDETQSLLTDRLPDKVEPECARALQDATEGWVAGIQMLAMAWRSNGDPQLHRASDTPGRIRLSESILHSTFERMAPETTAFLLQVSVFDRFTPALCEDVIGVRNAAEVLDKLASDGVMLVPLDNDEQWFRFHPLFTDYLRRRLVLQVVDNLGHLHARARACLEQADPFHSPQFSQLMLECHGSVTVFDLRALHLRASAWFERHGNLTEAVRHALAAGETNPAYDLIERCAMDVVAEGGLNTVLAWVANMPPEQVATRWRLRLAHYWAQIYSSDLQAAATEVEALAAGVGAENGVTPFEYLVCRGSLDCLSERNADLLELKGLWPPSGDAFHNAIACNILSYAYLSIGDYDKVREIQAWQREQPKHALWMLTYVWNQTLSSWHLMIQGDFRAAEDLLIKAVQLADKRYGRRSSPACAVAGYLAELLYETDALRQLDDLLAGRLDVINQMTFFESLVRAYQTGARLRFARGDVNAAYDLLDQLHMYGTSKGLLRPVATALGERIRMVLLQENKREALELLARLEHIAAPFGNDAQWGRLGNRLEIPVAAGLSRARCAIAQGDIAGALRALEMLAASSMVMRRFDFAVRVQLLIALAYWSGQQSAPAVQAIGQLLRITSRAGTVRVYLDEGGTCAALLKEVEAQWKNQAPDLEVAVHLTRVLNAFGANSPQQEAAVPHRDMPSTTVAENLSAREKDVLRFLVQGMPNKRIATTMNVSIDTVKWHLKNLFAKLEVADRLQAVDKARKNDLIDQP
jgi:LuxR family maltose regulon positive regulatory protein